MEWHTVNDNKCIIYYRKNSIRGKIPIIFLHGAGSDSKIFLPLLKELQNDCSFIVPDFPAHGRSEIKTIPTFDDYFNSISAIIEKECIDSFIA
ncbi:MAG: alpha/beta hydrolase, partial [Spirochaetes bacterium]|nr:alpha/beta hydrolase [Spirochaetota bacterium]